ncbi:MAG: DUF2927 domain-containing protein [Sulfitobacter sp.]
MLKWGAVAMAVTALVGCEPAAVAPTIKPQARPVPVALPAPVVARPTSEKSAAMRSYLNQVQTAQLSQGLLRRDGGGADTPFTADVLARNFEQIAFFNEYSGGFVGRGGASPLHRWRVPVRIEVIFGAGVPPSQRKDDAAIITEYAARLARVSGHPVSTSGKPNFIVIVTGEDDRADTLKQAAARVPGVSGASLRALRDIPRDTYCAVAADADGRDANTYTAAVAVIRAENPDLLRLSCIHEELAQGLGLPNDSPGARPSIFNDDDEFALLTGHDELLLKMLYDPRLKIGMTASEAQPITRTIARELTGGPI